MVAVHASRWRVAFGAMAASDPYGQLFEKKQQKGCKQRDCRLVLCPHQLLQVLQPIFVGDGLLSIQQSMQGCGRIARNAYRDARLKGERRRLFWVGSESWNSQWLCRYTKTSIMVTAYPASQRFWVLWLLFARHLARLLFLSEEMDANPPEVSRIVLDADSSLVYLIHPRLVLLLNFVVLLES